MTFLLFRAGWKMFHPDEKDTYKINRLCKNCDAKVEVNIPKGISFENYPCPKCGITALIK